LEVAVLVMEVGESFKRGDLLFGGLTDADQDAAREGDLELSGGFDGCQALRRVLGRRAGVDGVHQALGDGLQHQALRGGYLSKAGKVGVVEHTDVGVRKQSALQGAFAGPDDI